jgi:hypothetical protein
LRAENGQDPPALRVPRSWGRYGRSRARAPGIELELTIDPPEGTTMVTDAQVRWGRRGWKVRRSKLLRLRW